MEKAKQLISIVAMRESPESFINGLTESEIKEMLEFFNGYEDRSRVSKFIRLLEKKTKPKRDKLPRLNYLTMQHASLQYARDNVSEMEEITIEYLCDIWDSLSDEDRDWILDNTKVSVDDSFPDHIDDTKRLIEMIYNEK